MLEPVILLVEPDPPGPPDPGGEFALVPTLLDPPPPPPVWLLKVE